MGRWRSPFSTPEGDFNTRGQNKCPYCGDWFPEAWVLSHMDKCPNNPAKKEEA